MMATSIKTRNFHCACLLLAAVQTTTAIAQQDPPAKHQSSGRGAPMLADLNDYEMTGATMRGGMGLWGPGAAEPKFTGGALPGETPEGITPLAVDIFTSKDFYQDRELWMDPRYYRCNSSSALEDLWGSNRQTLTGDNPLKLRPGVIAIRTIRARPLSALTTSILLRRTTRPCWKKVRAGVVRPYTLMRPFPVNGPASTSIPAAHSVTGTGTGCVTTRFRPSCLC